MLIRNLAILFSMVFAVATLGIARPAVSQKPERENPVKRFLADPYGELSKAAEAARLQYGDQDERYADALLDAQEWAPIYHELRPITEANIRKAQAIFERTRGHNSIQVARCLLALVKHYRVPGPWNSERKQKLPEVRQLLARVLNIYESNGLDESEDAEVILGKLGKLEQETGNPAAAEVHLKRALAIAEEAAGPNDERVISALSALRGLYHQQKRFDEIEPLYRRTISIAEAIYGVNDRRTDLYWNGLAQYYRSRCRDVEADNISRRTSARRAQVLAAQVDEMDARPDSRPSALARRLSALGDAYRQMDQWADAERAYTRAVAILEKGGSRGDIWRARAGLAESHLRQGHISEAEREYQGAADEFRGGENKRLPLAIVDGLATVHEATSRDDEAAALRAEAAEARKRMQAARKCL
jgi:tetratricopeptide (TPR) repeat protein